MLTDLQIKITPHCQSSSSRGSNMLQCSSVRLLTREKQNGSCVDCCVGRSLCASIHPITRAKQKWTFAPNYTTVSADWFANKNYSTLPVVILWKIQRNISQCSRVRLLSQEKQTRIFLEYTIFNDHRPEFTDAIFIPQNVDFSLGRSQCASMYPISRAKQKWAFTPSYTT